MLKRARRDVIIKFIEYTHVQCVCIKLLNFIFVKQKFIEQKLHTKDVGIQVTRTNSLVKFMVV